ncbi:TerD family protein [Massilia horti]|uniref:TerD family protein n=1 Tax=Massilia horti TaxID=2562153 RepID=A0A4Y9T771_9BURK|nr:TerD family protein [Massilia horti]TFW33186.1 TerD family protein [Massilia horti]
MAISLQKGRDVSLAKEVPGLQRVIVGLGWDPRITGGASFDLDGSVFLLRADGKVRNDQDFIFYNNLVSSDGSVEIIGDNRTGQGELDDELIAIDLVRVPQDIARIVVAATIHEAEQRHQNFGMVTRAFIHCLNADDETEIARYELSQDSATETAMIFGELYRVDSDWQFRAVGQGYHGELAPLARSFGVNA